MAGRIFFARYQEVEPLGTGGIGQVFKVVDLLDSCPRALKFLKPEFRDTSVETAFGQEFSLLRRLSHPHIVSVFDFHSSPSEGTAYSMELVSGEALDRFIKLRPEEFNRAMWQVSRIIEFLHLQGIIHCDLKPDNFKVARDEHSPHPLVKLLDFGLADSPELIKENKVKGTLHFIAPEILKSQDYTRAADLYSLGVILYLLATGRLPFDAADPAVLISHILDDDFVPPRQISGAVSEELQNLITKLLTKDPAHRISSATEVREFFESQLPSKGESACRQDWTPALESGEWVASQPAWDKITSFLKVANRTNKKLVFVCGNPGTGKKRAMSETLYHCQKQGLPEFLGGLNSPQTGQHDTFLDRLAGFCRYSPPEQARLSAQIDALKSDSKSSNFYPRLAEVLSQIPAVILIESVEYETDLQLLVGLAERYGRLQSQIFVSFNPFPGQMEKLEQFIHSRPETEQIELVQIMPLATEQTTQLLKSKLPGFSVPEELLTQAWDQSGGNPALVVEYLAELWNSGRLEFRRGKIVLTKKASAPTLPAHEDYFRWMKAGLNPAQLTFLQKASILGKKFELQAAVELTGEPLTVVYDYLKSLLTEGVLTPVATEDTLEYEFSPPILQQFFYAENTRENESKLHHRAGLYWEERKSKGEQISAQKIARHFIHSPDAEKGYSYALEAADEAARSFSKTELLEFLKHALRLAEQTADAHERLVRQAQVYRKKAHFWKTVGNFEKSLTAYRKVLKLFPKNAQENVLAGTYKDLGDLYRIKNSYRKGMVCLGRAEKIYRALGDKSELAHTLNNIGNLYWMTLNHQKALEYLNSALLLHRETGSDSGAASTLNNLAGVYSDLNQYQNSIKYFSESLEIHKRQNHAEETARVLNNLGVVYMYIASYQKAQDSLLESLRINHSTGNLREQVFNLENLGECFLKLGNPSQSLSYSREGLNLAERIGFAFRRGRIQRNIGKSLSQLGEYSSAQESLEEAFQSAENVADTEAATWILLDSAELYLILNRPQRAQEYFDRSQSLLEKLSDTRLKAFSRLIRGRLLQNQGDINQAQSEFQASVELARSRNLLDEELAGCLDLLFLKLGRESPAEAEESLRQAEMLIQKGELSHFAPLLDLARALYWQKKGDKNQALQFVMSGLEAVAVQQNPEPILRISLWAGRLWKQCNDYQQAYYAWQKGAIAFSRAYKSIKLPELKQSYQTENYREELVREFKEMARLLSGSRV